MSFGSSRVLFAIALLTIMSLHAYVSAVQAFSHG